MHSIAFFKIKCRRNCAAFNECGLGHLNCHSPFFIWAAASLERDYSSDLTLKTTTYSATHCKVHFSWLDFYSLKLMYSEKATKFYEISTFLSSVCTVDKSKVEISQNFVAFSEYMDFNPEKSGGGQTWSPSSDGPERHEPPIHHTLFLNLCALACSIISAVPAESIYYQSPYTLYDFWGNHPKKH